MKSIKIQRYSQWHEIVDLNVNILPIYCRRAHLACSGWPRGCYLDREPELRSG